MSSKDIRPKWWQLYLALPFLILLFAVDTRLKLSTRGHQIVQIGIILLIYMLVHVWLKANASALSKMDQKQYRGKVRVIQIPVYQPPESGHQSHPRFHLSDSEIKGMLSDTFEVDYLDSETFPVDEVARQN